MTTGDERHAWRLAMLIMPCFSRVLNYTGWDMRPATIPHLSDAWRLVDILYPIDAYACGEDAILAKRVLYACAPQFVAYVENLPAPRETFTLFVRTMVHYSRVAHDPVTAIDTIRQGPLRVLWDLLLQDVTEWPGSTYGISIYASEKLFLVDKLVHVLDMFMRDQLHVRVAWTSPDGSEACYTSKVMAMGPRDSHDSDTVIYDVVFGWPNADTDVIEYVTTEVRSRANSRQSYVFRRNSSEYYRWDITFVEETTAMYWLHLGLPPWVSQNPGTIYDPLLLKAPIVLQSVPTLREQALRRVFHPDMWSRYTRHEQRRVLSGLGLLLLDSRKVKRSAADMDQEEGSLITREAKREQEQSMDLFRMPNDARIEQERQKRPRLGDYAFSVR